MTHIHITSLRISYSVLHSIILLLYIRGNHLLFSSFIPARERANKGQLEIRLIPQPHSHREHAPPQLGQQLLPSAALHVLFPGGAVPAHGSPDLRRTFQRLPRCLSLVRTILIGLVIGRTLQSTRGRLIGGGQQGIGREHQRFQKLPIIEASPKGIK